MRDTRYPWETAYPVALDICSRLRKACERIEVAGSLRRHKDTVGDIEILYIPVVREEVPDGRMFPEPVNQAEGAISHLISEGVLGLRLTVESRTTYGPLNKLMVHVASAIPVDLLLPPGKTGGTTSSAAPDRPS